MEDRKHWCEGIFREQLLTTSNHEHEAERVAKCFDDSLPQQAGRSDAEQALSRERQTQR